MNKFELGLPPDLTGNSLADFVIAVNNFIRWHKVQEFSVPSFQNGMWVDFCKCQVEWSLQSQCGIRVSLHCLVHYRCLEGMFFEIVAGFVTGHYLVIIEQMLGRKVELSRQRREAFQ